MLMSLKETRENTVEVAAEKLSPLFPLCVDGLVFERDGKRIISNLSVRLEDVRCTAIIGANGAGKSVLLRLLHGLLTPTAGTISWGNKGFADQHEHQAMVFQKPVLLKRSVAANLQFVLKRQGLSGEALNGAVLDYLDLANLREAANRAAHVLSGGEAQRLAIARALATQPGVLLLDEPTASLDPNARASIEELLKQVMANGVRVIIVTQDIGQAARLANKVIVMHEGEIAEHGPVNDVLDNPKSVQARDFLNHNI